MSLTIQDVDFLHRLAEAQARKAVVPCKFCRYPVFLTPVQMAAGEEIGRAGVICAECWDRRNNDER
jgi:hypothetical protein